MGIQAVTQTIKHAYGKASKFRDSILGGALVITAIVLVALVIQQCHFTQVTPNWVRDYSPHVLQTGDLNKLILMLTGAAGSAGIGLFLLKSDLVGKSPLKKRIQKVALPPKLKPAAREFRFLFCILLISSIIAGGIIACYGLYSLASTPQVFDLNKLTKHLFSLGYLDKGHAIEYGFAAFTIGTVVSIFSLMQTLDKFRLRD